MRSCGLKLGSVPSVDSDGPASPGPCTEVTPGSSSRSGEAAAHPGLRGAGAVAGRRVSPWPADGVRQARPLSSGN